MPEISIPMKRPPRLSSLQTIGRRMLAAFRNALLPARCASCGAWVAGVESPGPLSGRVGFNGTGCREKDQSNGREIALADAIFSTGLTRLYALLCEDCRQHVIPVQSPQCTVCGRVFAGREGLSHRCSTCLERSRHFASARSAVLYTTVFRKVIHQYKYHGKLNLAAPLGEILLATFLRYWNSSDMDLFLPVPLHPKRFRQRGVRTLNLKRLYLEVA